ncbi:MAG: hypothetical protein M4579_004544 [Chaenotheca gracillima]|nr:MAG: hypothetical protein M4579_004544 [Chaenotheca gracillima]
MAHIELFKRQYLQLQELDSLAFPPDGLLREASVQARLYVDMFMEDSNPYMPPERYQMRVLKKLISMIENSISDPDEDEISSDLMTCLSSFMVKPLPSESTSAQQKAYVSYSLPSDLGKSADYEKSMVTLLESRSLISGAGTTGLRTWEAALHLGTFLTSPIGRGLVEGRNVLELGAGTGFVSILCAKYLCANSVLATDGDEGVVENMSTNAFLNGLDNGGKLAVRPLKWGRMLSDNELSDYRGQLPNYDLVLGADITYDVSIIPLLVSSLTDLFNRFPKVQVIVAATLRNEDTFRSFEKACSESMKVDEIREAERVEEKHNLDIVPVDAAVPTLKNQSGLFHPTEVPIRISSITRAGPASDPFAI